MRDSPQSHTHSQCVRPFFFKGPLVTSRRSNFRPIRFSASIITLDCSTSNNINQQRIRFKAGLDGVEGEIGE